MTVIDGIRYRPEDAREAGHRPTGDELVLAATRPTAPARAPEGGLFDPGEHTVPEILAHLAGADETEAARVLAAEQAGQARKGIVGTSAPAPAGGSGGTAS